MLAMVTSYGLCSALGFSFSPLHNFIPFLLLGLGVDDMFVIVQAYDMLVSFTLALLD
jgi:predicted RND superfamily exporter protein